MYLKKRHSILLALAILGAFFAFSIFITKQGREEPAPRARLAQFEPVAEQTQIPPAEQPQAGNQALQQQAGKEAATFVLNKFQRSETRDGRKVWEVSAQTGQYFPESNTAQLADALLWLYKEDGSTTELRAAKARLFFEGNGLAKAELSGDVTFVANGEVKATAKDATYDKAAGTVKAPGDVEIRSSSMKITGTGLHVDIEHQTYTISKMVRTTIYQTDKKTG